MKKKKLERLQKSFSRGATKGLKLVLLLVGDSAKKDTERALTGRGRERDQRRLGEMMKKEDGLSLRQKDEWTGREGASP